MSSIISVNVGLPRTLEDKPLLVSAIDKLPADGPVAVRNLSLEGDGVGNQAHHGGVHQAVYAFASEDLTWWSAELGRPVRPGLFGENLTTEGIDLNSCVIGEQWLVGSARLLVTSARTPCPTFTRWMGLQGFDNADWEARFVRRGRPGVYLSILEQGWVYAGDLVTVIDRPEHGVTAGFVFRALTVEPAMLPLLLEVDGLPPRIYAKAEKYVATH